MKATNVILILLVVGYFSSCTKKKADCPLCPVVRAVKPDRGFKGDTVSVVGANFSSNFLENSVKFNGVEVQASDMISGSNIQLKVRVPENCGTGPVTVDISGELRSEPGPVFNYEPAEIVNFLPLEGFKGDTITITGKQFSPAKNIVKFNGVKAIVVSENDTQIKAVVPVNCGTGQLTVTLANNSVVKSSTEFQYNYTYKVSTYAGVPKTEGELDGPVATATFKTLSSICADLKNRCLYVSDLNCIRKIFNEQVTTYAGEQLIAGYVNGIGKAARLANPGEMTVNSSGELFIADQGNHCIRRVQPTGSTATYCGKGQQAGDLDGNNINALLNGPSSVKLYNDSIFYISDFLNGKLKYCNKQKEVRTVPLKAMSTALNITIKDNHTLIGSDPLHHQLVKMDLYTYEISTFAGSGQNGADDGDVLSASFSGPSAVAIRTVGKKQEMYVADKGNHSIRLIDARNKVRTVIGGTMGYADGYNRDALFNGPVSLTFDAFNNSILYVVDAGNYIIRKVVID